jgi:hypothetical protein
MDTSLLCREPKGFDPPSYEKAIEEKNLTDLLEMFSMQDHHGQPQEIEFFSKIFIPKFAAIMESLDVTSKELIKIATNILSLISRTYLPLSEWTVYFPWLLKIARQRLEARKQIPFPGLLKYRSHNPNGDSNDSYETSFWNAMTVISENDVSLLEPFLPALLDLTKEFVLETERNELGRRTFAYWMESCAKKKLLDFEKLDWGTYANAFVKNEYCKSTTITP